MRFVSKKPKEEEEDEEKEEEETEKKKVSSWDKKLNNNNQNPVVKDSCMIRNSGKPSFECDWKRWRKARCHGHSHWLYIWYEVLLRSPEIAAGSQHYHCVSMGSCKPLGLKSRRVKFACVEQSQNAPSGLELWGRQVRLQSFPPSLESVDSHTLLTNMPISDSWTVLIFK